MSHVAFVRFVEPMASASLANLIHQQMIQRSEALPLNASGDLETSIRAKEWEALAGGLWRMATDKIRGKAPIHHLP